MPSRNHQHLSGGGKWTPWIAAGNSEAWGTSPSRGVAVLEGLQLLGGVRCQPASLLNLLAAEAGREENLVFIVWLFLISFCFRDPLLRENNALRGSGFPRLGTRPALGEVAPRSQPDTRRPMTSDSHLLRNLWARWGLVAGSNPLLLFVIICLGLGVSLLDLIYEYSLKTFPICPGRTVLRVPPGKQYHWRLAEQSGLSNPQLLR